jgi:hypothetical protein
MGSLGRRGIKTRPTASPLMVTANIAEYDAAGFASRVDHQGISFGGRQSEAHPKQHASEKSPTAT